MDEEFALQLIDHIVASNKNYNMLITKMKEKYPEGVYSVYLEKIAHMIALSFDMIDEIGKKYPHLDPYKNEENNHWPPKKVK